MRKATVGEVGVSRRSQLLEGLLEIAPDERAHALRLAVVGVVVARRERVGADQAAALDLAAEAPPARGVVHLEDVVAGTRRP